MNYSTVNIVKRPHPVLYQVAEMVGSFDPELHMLSRRMIELMLGNRGVGLAANQVGVPLRLFVAHVPGATKEPTAYFNPVIVKHSPKMKGMVEGCLSDPAAKVHKIRSAWVDMEYADAWGTRFNARAMGLLARVWQHEIDHLNGINIRPRPVEVTA